MIQGSTKRQGSPISSSTKTAGPSLSSFEGAWGLEKDIVDEVIGAGRFQGTARFTRQGDALTYVETGVLTPPGTSAAVEAERRYIWREIQGWIAIAFEDGRPFHAIPVGVLDPNAVHLCDPDRYEVAYSFATWPEWTVVWNISGPRKAYKMTVRYWRP